MTPLVDVDLGLARDAWATHPRFPAQTLLLGSHDNFRRMNASLLQRATGGMPGASIGRIFAAWKAAMRSHEGYEEYKLYPYLTHVWGLSFEACEAGHRALGHWDVEVRAAAAAPGPATPELCDALAMHQEVLLHHLEEEERLVIPALLSLSPEAFEAYTTGDIRELLRA